MLIGIPARRLLIERRPAGLETVGTSAAEWTAVSPPDSAAHPWDLAHRAVRRPAALGLESVQAPHYAEPDFVQTFPFPRPESGGFEGTGGHPAEAKATITRWIHRPFSKDPGDGQ